MKAEIGGEISKDLIRLQLDELSDGLDKIMAFQP